VKDSEFWRELASEFLNIDREGTLFASYRVYLDDNSRTFNLTSARSDSSTAPRFEARVMHALTRIPNVNLEEPIIMWLNMIMDEHLEGPSFEARSVQDDVERSFRAGTIRLCFASAGLCARLEAKALWDEIHASQNAGAGPTQAIASRTSESVSQQIENFIALTELTTEKFAEEIDLDPRTVRRHISGETIPLGRLIARYNRVLSRLLKIEVVIK
jgi:hypothetical protein